MKVNKNQKDNNCQNNNNTNNNNYESSISRKDTLNSKRERVLVYVRIRPFNEDELIKDKTTPIEFIDTKNNAMVCKKKIYFI